MADNRSTLGRFTTAAGHVGSILSRLDIDALDPTQVKVVGTIKRLLADTRLDIRDWEMAETREDMVRFGRDGLRRLEQSREAILLASQHDIFSPIDVAEILAQFDQFAAELRA